MQDTVQISEIGLTEDLNSLVIDDLENFKVVIDNDFKVSIRDLDLSDQTVAHSVLRQIERHCVFHAQGLFRLHSKREFKILDIGGGTNVEALMLRNMFPEAEITIIEPEVINTLSSLNTSPRIKLVHTNFENFSSNEKFDLILFHFVLEHCELDLLQSMVDKAVRLLKPNGELSLVVPNRNAFHRKLEASNHIGREEKTMLAQEDSCWDHKPLLSNSDLLKIINTSISQADNTMSVAHQTIMPRPLSFKYLRHLSENIILCDLYTSGHIKNMENEGSVSTFLIGADPIQIKQKIDSTHKSKGIFERLLNSFITECIRDNNMKQDVRSYVKNTYNYSLDL